MVKSYRDLLVWQKSMEFVFDIYRATAHFPKTEQYGLTSQLQRAAISVPSNIAEGHQRNTRKDYRHFVGNAKGSVAELDTQLIIAQKLGYLSEKEYLELNKKLEYISRMLWNLLKSLEDAQ